MPDNWYEKIFENRHSEINEFIQKKQAMGRSPRTLNAYSRILKEFFHDIYPELRPHEVTVGHVENYVIQLDHRGCSHNTKRRYLESLSSFYTWALKRPRFEEITGDPAGVVLEELPKKVHDRPDCATWGNAKKIVHRIGDPRDKMVAILMAKTGCRVKEALEIHLEDLMLEDGFIRLRKRKGGKQGVVPVDRETIQALERYQFVRGDPDADYLFVSLRGGQLGRERIRRSVRRGAVQAGIMEEGETRFQKKFTPHTFRTVFTSMMRNCDPPMPDHYLRFIRGDTKNKEAMDIYTRIDRTKIREEYLKRIEELEL